MNDLNPRKQSHKGILFPRLAVLCALATLLLDQAALGQTASNAQSDEPSYSISVAGSSNQSSSAGAVLGQQSPFSGSVPEGKATGTVLPLSFKDAIERGLRNNLGILLQSDTSLTVRGERWKELSGLLPNLNGQATQSAAQIDLPSEGFRFNIPGVPKVVGPIGIFQSSISLQQSVFDGHAIERYRGARQNERA